MTGMRGNAEADNQPRGQGGDGHRLGGSGPNASLHCIGVKPQAMNRSEWRIADALIDVLRFSTTVRGALCEYRSIE